MQRERSPVVGCAEVGDDVILGCFGADPEGTGGLAAPAPESARERSGNVR